MNKERVVNELRDRYPGANLFFDNEDNPSEIVAEIDPENGVALAVIDRSTPHHHEETIETYKVEKGSLDLFVDGKRHELNEGDIFTIEPGSVHYAVGKEAVVWCVSVPPWSPDDHILLES